MRCARCGHTWVASPEPDPPADPAHPAPEHGPKHGPEPPPSPLPPGFPTSFPVDFPWPLPTGNGPAAPAGPPRAVLAAAWAASLLLLAASAWAALAWRAEITAAWPPAARAFTALGLGG